MADQKSRTKALKTVVAQAGFGKIALTGKENDQIELVGDGIDEAELTCLLRKKVSYADLVSVNPIEKKKRDKKDDKKPTDSKPDVSKEPPIGTYNPYPRYQLYEIKDPCPDLLYHVLNKVGEGLDYAGQVRQHKQDERMLFVMGSLP